MPSAITWSAIPRGPSRSRSSSVEFADVELGSLPTPYGTVTNFLSSVTMLDDDDDPQTMNLKVWVTLTLFTLIVSSLLAIAVPISHTVIPALFVAHAISANLNMRLLSLHFTGTSAPWFSHAWLHYEPPRAHWGVVTGVWGVGIIWPIFVVLLSLNMPRAEPGAICAGFGSIATLNSTHLVLASPATGVDFALHANWTAGTLKSPGGTLNNIKLRTQSDGGYGFTFRDVCTYGSAVRGREWPLLGPPLRRRGDEVVRAEGPREVVMRHVEGEQETWCVKKTVEETLETLKGAEGVIVPMGWIGREWAVRERGEKDMRGRKIEWVW
ncbi:hypothetical protein EDC01DRAFT_638583 [Geopyxis carbonaria]|nr:hypothetical protein EDC01DRAFT_638583 [Geopyxis carbonaria]